MKAIISPQDYFDKIKSLRSPEEILALCEQLTAGLFNETDKPKTRVNKLTPYNKLVNTIPNEELVENENSYVQTKQDGTLWKRHLHFKFTGLADTKWHGDGGINTKTVVLDRLENRREVVVTQYLETVSKLLLSDDPHELAVGLIAASGRRPVEILARGSFTLATDLPTHLKQGYFVNFKGQAKKRDYDLPESERTDYRIGVLVPAESFLDAFKRFRQMPEAKELLQMLKAETKKGTDPETINDMIESRRGNSLRRVVAREFGSFLPARFGDNEINNKSLRAVYVRLITDRDCPKSIADILWASRSVGHFIDTQKPDDSQLRHLLTTLGYFDYYADSAVPFVSVPQKPEPEKLMQVRVFSEDFEAIKELQKKWDLTNQQTVVRQLVKSLEETEVLKQQLLEAQSKITQLQQQESEQMTTPQIQPEQPATEDLQAMIKRMITEALAEALPQLQQALPQSPVAQVVEDRQTTPTPKEEHKPQRQERVKAEPKEIDWESVSSTELKANKFRGKGVIDEKLRRAFLAITSYNDAQPSNETRWAITNQALRQLSGCNGMAVSDWMERYRVSIDDHNSKYGLGQYHNKGRGDITEVISW